MGPFPGPRRGLRWLGAIRSRRAERRTKQELESLRLRAASATSSYRPHYYLQAAKLAVSLDLRHEALSLYGCAINGYLETGRGRAAEVACQDVLAAYPDVVRARRTLALMALGRGESDRAVQLVHDYAEAARRFSDPQLTRRVLIVMESIAESDAVRQRTGEELRALGPGPDHAPRIDPDAAAGGDVLDTRAGSWSRALQTALLAADELRHLLAG